MKKIGFTVVETLATILVIGVLASIVLPTFVTESKKQINANSLSNAISTFELAMTTYMHREGVEDILDTGAWRVLLNNGIYSLDDETADGTINSFIGNLGSSFKIRDFNTDSTSYKTLSGGEFSNDALSNAITLVAKNGVEYKIFANQESKANAKSESDALLANVNYTNRAAVVFIDVNGRSLPNVIGRDLFWFDLGTDGRLYPFGSRDYCFYNNVAYNNVKLRCKTIKAGEYCAVYLMENSYKMDY